MSSSEPKARDANYWYAQMAAVSLRRDRDCFMRIYDHFAPRVRLYLKGLGSPEVVAEELAQEALLRLWQRAGLYDPACSSLSTWLFRIARNLHIDRVRREPCWVAMQDKPGWPDKDDASGFSSLENHVEQAELKKRIEHLPAIQARLIRTSYFEAKSRQEIADELGMPLGTVKSSLRRTFLRLQLSMSERASMNPRHHLDQAMVLSFAAGALSPEMAAVAATHREVCRLCRERLSDAERIGRSLLGQQQPAAADTARGTHLREAMLERLDEEPEIEARTSNARMQTAVADCLPRPLQPYFGQTWPAPH